MAASPPSAATCFGFLLLTGNTIMAIRRSCADGDAAGTAFAATSYTTLVLLFYCLRQFESSPAGSAARRTARAGVWVTTTLLTGMFTWRVSALMPWPVSAGVCLMGAATVVAGFYALFLAPPPTGDD